MFLSANPLPPRCTLPAAHPLQWGALCPLAVPGPLGMFCCSPWQEGPQVGSRSELLLMMAPSNDGRCSAARQLSERAWLWGRSIPLPARVQLLGTTAESYFYSGSYLFLGLFALR